MFCGLNDYHRTKHKRTETGIIRVPDEGIMTEAQIALSAPLKALFSGYLNRLALTDESGALLTLNESGEGSFKDYVKRFVIEAADRELTTHTVQSTCDYLMKPGSSVDDQTYLKICNGHVIDLDWDAFVSKITRMKATPAFDAVNLKSPENEEFGDESVDARHFTAFSMEHNTAPGAELADAAMVKRLNPTMYLDEADVAKHWRIRHGALDRDTSLAIPVILATLLRNKGYDVDFALPWGLPHSGDYDLPELFAWIDALCLK